MGANFLALDLRLEAVQGERNPDPGKRGNGDSFHSGIGVGKFPPGRHSLVPGVTATSCICFRQSKQAIIRDSFHLSRTKKDEIISCSLTGEILEGRDCVSGVLRGHTKVNCAVPCIYVWEESVQRKAPLMPAQREKCV